MIKTSRLIVKRFFIVRDTQKGSQSYIKKRRGRKEIEVTRRRRGRVKRRETNLASNEFPKCSPQPRTHKENTELDREERGQEEIDVTCRRKRRVKSGESHQGSNRTPK